MQVHRRQPSRHIELTFDPKVSDLEATRGEISTCDAIEKTLFLAHDESSAVERLTWDGQRYADHQRFELADFISLPKDDGEMDIEGLAMRPPYLYVTGSMSTKRKKAKEDKDDIEAIERLASLKVDPNRFTLARIPCEVNDGIWTPVSKRSFEDETLRPSALDGGRESTVLTEQLHSDPHLAPFMKLPCKDNGFDIEGIAVANDRVLLGLRGPVLRGWAIVLELDLVEMDGHLRFANRGDRERAFHKHLLNLAGMGVRELRYRPGSDDLFLLAGPTMDLDGTISLWKLADGLPVDRDTIHRDVQRLFDVVDGSEVDHGCDKAEGFAILPNGNFLIAYDSPMPHRFRQDNGVVVDEFSGDGSVLAAG